MKIDVATPNHLKHIEDMMRTMMKSVNDDYTRLKELVMQLQDRIKMLEAQNE